MFEHVRPAGFGGTGGGVGAGVILGDKGGGGVGAGVILGDKGGGGVTEGVLLGDVSCVPRLILNCGATALGAGWGIMARRRRLGRGGGGDDGDDDDDDSGAEASLFVVHGVLKQTRFTAIDSCFFFFFFSQLLLLKCVPTSPFTVWTRHLFGKAVS